jgi:hypothetical protein
MTWFPPLAFLVQTFHFAMVYMGARTTPPSRQSVALPDRWGSLLESFSVATEKGNIGLLYDGDVSSLAPILAGSRDGREMLGE